MNIAEQVKEKLAELEQGLNKKLPGIDNLLRSIHVQLSKDPEVVTLLSEEECAILIAGLKNRTGVTIATAALAKPRNKALKYTTLDDL